MFSISLCCRVKVYFAILSSALLWAWLARNVRLRSQLVYSVLNKASPVYHARVDLLNIHSQAEIFRPKVAFFRVGCHHNLVVFNLKCSCYRHWLPILFKSALHRVWLSWLPSIIPSDLFDFQIVHRFHVVKVLYQFPLLPFSWASDGCFWQLLHLSNFIYQSN